MTRSSIFRGYNAMREVISRLQALAQGLQHRDVPCTVMTLRRRDLDLLQRWPTTAALFDVTTNDKGQTFWRGFELRADKSEARYSWTT